MTVVLTVGPVTVIGVTVMLTDTAVKNAKPGIHPKHGKIDRPYKLADSLGLYLLVNMNGSKWWRVDYRHQGKRKTLSAGVSRW
jgi:hypothetical protein